MRGLNPRYSKLEENLRDGTRKWQDLAIATVTAWCKDVDKNGNWREVRGCRRHYPLLVRSRRTKAQLVEEATAATGVAALCSVTRPRRLPGLLKEEAEEQNDPFYVQFLKKLGLVVKEASSASPADVGESQGGDDGDTQANTTPAAANVEDTDSTGRFGGFP